MTIMPLKIEKNNTCPRLYNFIISPLIGLNYNIKSPIIEVYMSKFWFFFLIFASLIPVYGLDLPVSGIADDSLLRISIRDSWMTEAPARVLSQRPVIHQLPNGERVRLHTMEGRDEFMVILSRELIRGRIESEAGPALERRPTGQFPGWAQGSWMLIRRKNSREGTLGEPISIRVFLRSDPFTYIQFRPLSSERAQMDAVLYGGYVMRSMPIAVPFERLYTMPLNDTLKLAGDKFPLKYFEPNPVYYRDSRKFISEVRKNLSPLQFADDGAIDENGNYIFIETLRQQPASTEGLNCSGFAKWLIDGILRPVTGQRLSIVPLKAKYGDRGSSLTEAWEASRDPYFGLDWIRNLATEANKTLRSAGYAVLDEFEVRSNTFASVLVSENRLFVNNSFPGFMPEAGFGIEGLFPLLYTLAVDNPFQFYIGAVNNEIGAAVTPANLRGSPRLRQYYHIAAFVPYFDETGTFKIAVFESAEETSFNDFNTRYSAGHHINLVQIPIVTTFDP
jgi:hypothetical protein